MNNDFGAEGAGLLAPALAQMTGLQTLDLVMGERRVGTVCFCKRIGVDEYWVMEGLRIADTGLVGGRSAKAVFACALGGLESGVAHGTSRAVWWVGGAVSRTREVWGRLWGFLEERGVGGCLWCGTKGGLIPIFACVWRGGSAGRVDGCGRVTWCRSGSR